VDDRAARVWPIVYGEVWKGDRTSGLGEAAKEAGELAARCHAMRFPCVAGLCIGDCDMCERVEGDHVADCGENALLGGSMPAGRATGCICESPGDPIP
jgi:hypothetical protein